MRTNGIVLVSLLLLLPAVLFQSCLKDEGAERRAEEKKILEQYLINEDITVEPTASGLYYIQEVEGTGSFPTAKDWIEFNYTARLVTNNAVVMTTDSLMARDNNIYDQYFLYGPNRMPMSSILLEGLFEGVMKMKEGGKARLIFLSDLGYGSNKVGNIPAFSSLIFDVELLEVIPDIISHEENKMNEYLIMNNIANVPTASGLVYQEILPGYGSVYPTFGSKVTFNYVASFLNGKVFDRYENGDYSIYIGYQQVIPGIEEGLKKMKEGGISRLIIPYTLAYGESGVFRYIDNKYYTSVWPYSTVIYQVELLAIE